MKTLIASIILFCILIAVIIVNVFYINQTVQELRTLTEEINLDSSDDEVKALIDTWQKRKKYLALSVSYSSLDEICDLVIQIASAYKAGNTEALERNKELLFDELSGITRFEKISIENVF